MPSNIEGTWRNKLQSANSYFKRWETKYKCRTLHDYYKGFQWKNKGASNTLAYNPYTINLVYSTIKIKVDGFIFQNPQYIISPRPTTYWNQDGASIGASIKQDAINAIVSNRDIKFAKRIRRVALDSFFYYGIMEVGYAADWRNPNKVRPLLKSDKDDQITVEQDRVIDQNELPESEHIYVKRIKPHRFRIAVSDEDELEELDWFGYYEYYNKRELQKIKGIDFPGVASQNTTQYYSETYVSAVVGDTEKFEDKEFLRSVANQDIVKCWHIWSPVHKQRYFLLDNGCYVLWQGDYERSPICTLRWDDSLDNWYPIPPVFQWLSPQDEINEAREQTRSFRRRFTRKFQAVEGKIDEEEKEKFTSGPDGILITVKQQDAITPIQNPEQGPTAENALLIAKDDFNIISGTSAEVRGQSDRETATEARIKSQRSEIRESAEQMDFTVFMCEVGREILLTASEKLTQPLWVKYTNTESNDPTAWRLINTPQLSLSDGYDFDIEVDITNATPAAMAQQQQSFMQFLAIVSQYPLVQLNPALIRESAYRCGYRNEKIIQQMQQAAIHQLQLQALQQQQAQNPQASGGGINEAKQTLAAQSSSPMPDQVNKQITNQIQ